jgi:hypothetical protein
MFDEVPADLMEISRNLQKRIDALIEAREKAATAVFQRVISDYYKECKEILKEYALGALQESEEFDYEPFKDALIDVINSNPVIIIKPINRKDLSAGITIDIPLERFAGDLDDYAAGIKYARDMLEEEVYTNEEEDEETQKKKRRKRKRKYNPVYASAYWKDHVYTPKGKLYAQTISWRLEGFTNEAPYWIILEYGSPGTLRSDKGGTPYPESIYPTRFRSLAEKDIESLILEMINLAGDTFYKRIEDEIAEVQTVIDDISNAIVGISSTPEEYRTPQIVQEIEYNNQQYYIYITQAGRIGLAKEPRAYGRRLSR